MSGGNSRTFRSGHSKSGHDNNARTLDLRSWQGLTDVLRRAREQAPNDEAYAQFRDRVLQYAQSGGDSELRREIEDAMKAFEGGRTPVAPKVTTKPDQNESKKRETFLPKDAKHIDQKEAYTQENKPQQSVEQEKEETVHEQKKGRPKFGIQRRTPSFSLARRMPGKTHVTQEEEKPEPEPKVAPQKNVPPPTNLPVHKMRESGGEETSDLGKKSELEAEAPPDLQVEKEEEKVEEKGNAKLHESEVPSVGALSGADANRILECKERIAAIKHSINTKTQNPITLVDDGNPIGRTYMSALLGAMKATAGGKAGTLNEKMEALEDAYSVLLTYLKEEGVAQEAKEVSTKSEKNTTEDLPQKERKEEEQRQETEAPSVPLPEFDVREEKKKEHAAEGEVRTLAEPEKQKSPSPRPQLDTTVQNEHVQKVKPKERLVPRAESEHTDVVKKKKHATLETTKTTLTENKAMQMDEPDPRSAPMTEQTITAAPSTRTVEEAPSTREGAYLYGSMPTTTRTDLEAPEVTESLKQLLLEWDLFRQSGLFKTGPTGIDHPLFQKLRTIDMSRILAGRWEGAAPHTTRIIRDYVNAWRNEQGVTYMPSETFEHYLRRVIVRILKRRKG